MLIVKLNCKYQISISTLRHPQGTSAVGESFGVQMAFFQFYAFKVIFVIGFSVVPYRVLLGQHFDLRFGVFLFFPVGGLPKGE